MISDCEGQVRGREAVAARHDFVASCGNLREAEVTARVGDRGAGANQPHLGDGDSLARGLYDRSGHR